MTCIRKFKMLDMVRVCDEMPPHMSYFDKDFYGIVSGSTNNNPKSYGLYKVENGKIVNSISWYYEDQLTLVESDLDENHNMMADYEWGGNEIE